MSDAPSVRAMFDAWEYLSSLLGQGWFRQRLGMAGGITGLPVATMNGVWCGRDDADPEEAAALLDEVAESGLPYCFQLPVTAGDDLSTLPRSRGMALDGNVPLMRLDARPTRAEPSALTFRIINTDEPQLHAQLAGHGFGVPADVFAGFLVPSVLAAPGVQVYVGEIDGEPVTTGLGVTLGDRIGVFNIATPPEHRGHGYGSAITAHLVEVGYANGASWAWLQSSVEGYRVYERLGFRTVDTWHSWVST